MFPPLSIRWLLAPGLVLVCSGCLFTHHQTNVVRQDETRREVQFESLSAQQAFAAKAFSDDARQAGVKTEVVTIPFLLWRSKMDVLSENAYYNDHVAACDVDGDGLITVSEAVAYHPAQTFGELAASGASRSGYPAVPASEQPGSLPTAPPAVQPASFESGQVESESGPQAAETPAPESPLRAKVTPVRRSS